MSHSYANILVHCAFSTKERLKMISPDFRQRLRSYLGGIARENGMKALAVGGVEDHVHVLLSLPATMSISKAIQLLKAGSSKWIHDHFPKHGKFSWQEGYGAFSIGISQRDETVAYIEGQEGHHKKRNFQGEFRAFLDEQGVHYDERFIWG
ncbi:MAG TPA: IS200/IS605 family transposase [Acidobacteriota bacterium]|nr:IS200/IS605 family transposase [Acidobacteriota bacterium]